MAMVKMIKMMYERAVIEDRGFSSMRLRRWRVFSSFLSRGPSMPGSTSSFFDCCAMRLGDGRILLSDRWKPKR